MSSIKRLRSWADESGDELKIVQHGPRDWYVEAHREDQVKFTLGSRKPSVEEAAAEVIAALEQVGEQIPAE
jgi:hypothetical protein